MFSQWIYAESVLLLFCFSLERPDPVNISIYNVTSKSVVLKWKENFNGNEIIRLFSLVYFINSSKMTSSKHVTFSSSTTIYQVNLLQPYSHYIFQISATNRIGKSNLTSVSVDTLQDGKLLVWKSATSAKVV